MQFRTILMASAMAASAIGFAGGASAADVKEVQMLHWWTSGGEAAALNVLKQDLAKEGYTWKDVPVAGGGGEGAMTALKAMVAAGNPPTASQILGYYAVDYAEAGKLGDITSLADKEGWAKVVPTALQKFTTTNGKWDAVPVNIHSVNWIWLNKAAMEKIGGTAAQDLRRLRRSSRQGQEGWNHSARAGRPALAGSDLVRLGRRLDRRNRLLQEGVHRPRRKRAQVGHDEEVVRQPRQASRLHRPELRRSRLEPRHGDGDQGRRVGAGYGRLG